VGSTSCSLLSPAVPTDTASRLLISVEPGVNTSSALASASDAITRLQQDHIQKERDLALRRQKELHDFYLDKLKEKELYSSYQSSDYLRLSGELDQAVKQMERYQSLHETQKLQIKNLQEELGEDDPKMGHLRRARGSICGAHASITVRHADRD
jgi:hypothetical protein